MDKTKAQLSADVLLGIGVTPAGETADAAHAEFVEDRYDSKYEELVGLGLATWSNIDRTSLDIPNLVYAVLRDIMANDISMAFGKSRTFEEVDAREQLLLKRLRRILSVKQTNTPTVAEYF